jgi:hypothetical protein
MIRKLILTKEEVIKVDEATAKNSFVDLKGEMRSFESKADHKELVKLQRSLVFIDIKENFLVMQRASEEGGEKRITNGHSIMVSSSTHDAALAKLAYLPKSKSLLIDKIITRNGNYVFDVSVYKVDDLSGISSVSPDKETIVEKDKLEELLQDKKMELGLVKRIKASFRF